MESGDHSLLPAPLSLRDLIWLKVCRKVKFETGTDKQKLFLLLDIREIMFATLGYTKEQQSERDNAYYSLPSMVEYKIKQPVQRLGTARMMTPEEIEQRKKKKEKK